MTLEEFQQTQPELARALVQYVGHPQHAIIMHVEQHDDRHVALIETAPRGEWEFVYEARCLPSCLNSAGRPRAWVYGNHRCCEQCERDPGHYYQAVHE